MRIATAVAAGSLLANLPGVPPNISLVTRAPTPVLARHAGRCLHLQSVDLGVDATVPHAQISLTALRSSYLMAVPSKLPPASLPTIATAALITQTSASRSGSLTISPMPPIKRLRTCGASARHASMGRHSVGNMR